LSRRYKIREFAELAGVTVKALHHYDRLGLLKPGRTEAGYRVYSERDLETLEQIIALKFLGVPLKEIGAVLKRPALELPDTLRLQRQALEDRQELLGRAIRAIRSAEEAIVAGNAVDLAMLKNIIEVIEMQNDVAVMKKYYSEESWDKHRRYYEEGPSREWQDFYRDAQRLLGEDPASDPAQALVQRWFDLSRRAHGGDPSVLTDSPAAWLDRAHWPEAIKHRAAEFKMEEVKAFVRRAAIASRKPAFSEDAWSKLTELLNLPREQHSAHWQARVDLFRDLEAAIGEDPAGERAQALVARWKAQIDEVSGGNAEIKSMLALGWSHRKNWPDSQRWQVENLHMMSYERFEKAADLLDQAIAASSTEKKEMTKTTLKSSLLDEFEEEMQATRKVLERVPDDQFEWRPSEKSFTLGKLANHIAAIPGVAVVFLKHQGVRPPEAANSAELLASFDKHVAACREQLENMSEERLAGKMLVLPGVERPVFAVLQGRGLLNHLIHHRGQLTVYLRLLGVAVPGMYGPSADEK